MDEKLRSLLAEVLRLPDEQVNDDLAMKDVDAWDSLVHMQLVLSLEQNFDIQLTFDEIVAMQSVREIKRVLTNRPEPM